MTVGSAVALTLMGVAYWLIPYLTDRRLWGRKLALASSWMYTIGVLIFARGMISAGLEGMPRRIYRAKAAYDNPSWDLGGILTGVGGTMMFIGIVAFFVVIAVTVLAGTKRSEVVDVPTSETLTAPSLTGWGVNLDRIWLWIGVAILLIVLAYGPFFLTYVPARFISPGFTGIQ
jgi:cytochrome c oxidase subunit 1